MDLVSFVDRVSFVGGHALCVGGLDSFLCGIRTYARTCARSCVGAYVRTYVRRPCQYVRLYRMTGTMYVRTCAIYIYSQQQKTMSIDSGSGHLRYVRRQ